VAGSEVAREGRLGHRLEVLGVAAEAGNFLRRPPERASRAEEWPVARIAEEGVDDGRLERRAGSSGLTDRKRRAGRERMERPVDGFV
jgi:hypothetical protein